MQEPLASSPQPASAGAAGSGEARAAKAGGAKASGETSVNSSVKDEPDKPAEPRLLSRLKWSLIGGVVALLALALLWWNEARIDATRLLQRAQVVDPGVSFPENDGRLVAVSGPPRVPEPARDPLYGGAGTLLRLERRVEILAWTELRDGDDLPGTGAAERYRYRHELRWTENPRPAASFRYPAGHENPPLPLHSERFTAAEAAIGVFRFDPRLATLPESQPLPLRGAAAELARGASVVGSAQRSGAPSSGSAQQRGAPFIETLDGVDYRFYGRGTLKNPQLGDVRVSFRAVPAAGEMSLFGFQSGDQILPAPRPRGEGPGSEDEVPFASFLPAPPAAQEAMAPQRLQRKRARRDAGVQAPPRPTSPAPVAPAASGDDEGTLRLLAGGRDRALQILEGEHQGTVWLVRIAGALALWLGLLGLSRPLQLLVFPALGPPPPSPPKARAKTPTSGAEPRPLGPLGALWRWVVWALAWLPAAALLSGAAIAVVASPYRALWLLLLVLLGLLGLLRRWALRRRRRAG